ncbi:MAG: MFS transporter [Acholeplasmataceae bacterium]|nr:MFS transporter [Acholeplasmataceae bacterium]
MKLDYKKIVYIGLIFFIISLFWQTYDMLIARTLIDKFGLNQTWSGIIMALDNIMAVFLLPIFGALSDKSNSKFGRRTPYIIVGTVLAAFAFMALSFADHQQSLKLQSTDIVTEHYSVAFNDIDDINESLHWQSIVDNMRNERLESYQEGRISGIDYDNWNEAINIRMQNILDANLNRLTTRELSMIRDLYFNYLSSRAWEVTADDPIIFFIFGSILFVSLVAMAIFRSPAVALMPDVTIKPLRSKANAVINLMGAAGGIIAVNTIMFSGLNKNTYDSHTAIYIIIGVLMLITLGIFLWKVREPKLVNEKREEDVKYNLSNGQDEKAISANQMSIQKRLSLYFLLASVFLWFAGYNAVMSKIADYLPKVLNMEFFELPFIIAQGVVVLTILPVGFFSMKLGRKRSVMLGIIILASAMSTVFFLGESSKWMVAGVIAFAGIGWTSISINSYPMVVELSQGANVGKYTGYYYSASMAAQIFTPIFSGILMDRFTRIVLFPYAAVFVLLSFVTMLFVKHGDAKKIPQSLLDALETD